MIEEVNKPEFIAGLVTCVNLTKKSGREMGFPVYYSLKDDCFVYSRELCEGTDGSITIGSSGALFPAIQKYFLESGHELPHESNPRWIRKNTFSFSSSKNKEEVLERMASELSVGGEWMDSNKDVLLNYPVPTSHSISLLTEEANDLHYGITVHTHPGLNCANPSEGDLKASNLNRRINLQIDKSKGLHTETINPLDVIIAGLPDGDGYELLMFQESGSKILKKSTNFGKISSQIYNYWQNNENDDVIASDTDVSKYFLEYCTLLEKKNNYVLI
jgi:hypothetical protein